VKSPAFFVSELTETVALAVPDGRERNYMQVIVRDNNVDQALRVLKKKMQREGVFREMRARSAYEKPSEKRAREKAEGIRRMRKMAKKKLQREGLLPAPKKPAHSRAR
jgi:small subunit ribosomal protein S21